MHLRGIRLADLAVVFGLLAAIAVLLLLGGCSQAAGDPQRERQAAGDPQRRELPPGWHEIERPITGVIYPPQVLAAATFPVTVPAHLRGCSPARVLGQMPPGGVLLQVFEYAARDSSGNRIRVPELPPRPARFHYRDADYGPFECAGHSYKFAYRQAGRALQAHVWFDRATVDAGRPAEALRILNNFVP